MITDAALTPLFPPQATPWPALAALLTQFATRSDARYCATADGAVNNCDVLAPRFALQARGAGMTAAVDILARAGNVPDAHPRWQALRSIWAPATVLLQHYVTRVTEPDTGRALIIDWTARQFDPAAPWPLVMSPFAGTYGWELRGVRFAEHDHIWGSMFRLRRRGRRTSSSVAGR
jgi:hypothetical protein